MSKQLSFDEHWEKQVAELRSLQSGAAAHRGAADSIAADSAAETRRTRESVGTTLSIEAERLHDAAYSLNARSQGTYGDSYRQIKKAQSTLYHQSGSLYAQVAKLRESNGQDSSSTSVTNMTEQARSAHLTGDSAYEGTIPCPQLTESEKPLVYHPYLDLMYGRDLNFHPYSQPQ